MIWKPASKTLLVIIQKNNLQPIISADTAGSAKYVYEKKDKTIKGFNIGNNSGEVAGQTIPHCHIHLIPRREDDVENPQGGVRSVIPLKQHYKRKV